MKQKRGYVHIYTGDSKGKTTASIGLACRAVGHDWRVIMLQFMKGDVDQGESEIARRLAPLYTVKQVGRDVFVRREAPDPVDVKMAREGWDEAARLILGGEYDMVVLDELCVAVDFDLVPETEVLDVLRRKPAHVEVVLTGRGASQGLIDAADLVTEMKQIKHYFSKGVDARIGIER